MIIDGHTHLGHLPSSFMQEYLKVKEPLFGAEHLLKSMDELGIDKAVVFSREADGHVGGLTYGREGLKGTGGHENEMIAKWLKQYPNRLMAFASINPLYGELAVEQLKICVLKLGFKGIKLRPTQCGYVAYNGRHDKYVDAIMEQAVKLKLPVLSHSDHFFMSAPHRFGWLADTYPDVTIIIGHMGGGDGSGYSSADAMWVAKKHDNVYLDTASTSPSTIKGAIQRVGAEKVNFGSDVPFNSHEMELKNIQVLGLPKDQERLVLGENIAKIIAKVPKY